MYCFHPSMPKFFIKTYGCQMNERDSEQVAHSLIARGYERVGHETEADVVLLNTCSVRDMADQKAVGKMGMLGRLAKERPHMVFGFLGCMAQARGESLLKNLPHVDLVVGTQKFHRVADYVDELHGEENDQARLLRIAPEPESRNGRSAFFNRRYCGGSRFAIDHSRSTAGAEAERLRSSPSCRDATCIARFASSRRRVAQNAAVPLQKLSVKCGSLVARGVKEVTLLGQIVNLVWSSRISEKSMAKVPFVQLLEAVHEIEGLERLRFTSPHPIGFRDDLIDAISRLPKLAEHVHLPLQSGSNKILKAMHRGYTAEKYVDLVRRIRHARDGIAITTDIIVGFPGETEDDYGQTRDLVEEIQFDNAFVFRYSPRRDTPAAEMPDQIDEHVKEQRNQDLLRGG